MESGVRRLHGGAERHRRPRAPFIHILMPLDRPVDEFQLIKRMAARLQGGHPEGVIGIGDDCAALPAPEGVQLLTCDVAVAGRHFTTGKTPLRDVGWRVATANVSDVCACGGLPSHALVSLLVPPGQDPAGLDALYDGLAEAEAAYGFRVIGGNVSGGGALAVDVFMLGHAPRFIARSGARPGDLVAVSGTLGDEEAGRTLLGEDGPPSPADQALIARHLRPRARTDLVPLLQTVASAAIDISDGLAAELNHLAQASGACLAVRGESIPLSSELRAFAEERGAAPLELALGGGEGYQLLFTLPAEKQGALAGRDVAVIGEVREGTGVLLDGAPLAPAGWNHLSQEK